MWRSRFLLLLLWSCKFHQFNKCCVFASSKLDSRLALQNFLVANLFLGIVTFDTMKLVESPLPEWLTLAWSEDMWWLWSLGLQIKFNCVTEYTHTHRHCVNECCFPLFIDGYAVCIGVLGQGHFCEVQHSDLCGWRHDWFHDWLLLTDLMHGWCCDWLVARVFVCELNSWQTCWASTQLKKTFLAKKSVSRSAVSAQWKVLGIWMQIQASFTALYQLDSMSSLKFALLTCNLRCCFGAIVTGLASLPGPGRFVGIPLLSW